MSSFIGHTVAAVAVYAATDRKSPKGLAFASDRHNKLQSRLLWLWWLIVIASLPDLDYVVKVWHSNNNAGLRITHSLAFVAIAPIITIVVLFFAKVRGEQLLWRSLQLILAALSHLLLDLLVGVTALPLLFPAIDIPYKLPFGILPSAGKIDLNNYYFYRNLKLEMGVLLPLLSLIFLWGDLFKSHSMVKNTIKIFLSTLLLDLLRNK